MQPIYNRIFMVWNVNFEPVCRQHFVRTLADEIIFKNFRPNICLMENGQSIPQKIRTFGTSKTRLDVCEQGRREDSAFICFRSGVAGNYWVAVLMSVTSLKTDAQRLSRLWIFRSSFFFLCCAHMHSILLLSLCERSAVLERIKYIRVTISLTVNKLASSNRHCAGQFTKNIWKAVNFRFWISRVLLWN